MYDQAIKIDPKNAIIYNGKGKIISLIIINSNFTFPFTKIPLSYRDV